MYWISKSWHSQVAKHYASLERNRRLVHATQVNPTSIVQRHHKHTPPQELSQDHKPVTYDSGNMVVLCDARDDLHLRPESDYAQVKSYEAAGLKFTCLLSYLKERKKRDTEKERSRQTERNKRINKRNKRN